MVLTTTSSHIHIELNKMTNAELGFLHDFTYLFSTSDASSVIDIALNALIE